MSLDTRSIAVGDTVTYIGPAGKGLPDPDQRGVIVKFNFKPDGSSDFVVNLQNGQVILPYNVWELYIEPGTEGTELNPTNWLGIIIGGLVVAGGVGAYVWYKHRDSHRDSKLQAPVKKNPIPYLPPDVEDYVTLHFKMMPHHIRYARGVVDKATRKLRIKK